MASPGWMYHTLRGKQLFPDLTPAFQRQLEAEGWRDSPEKVSGPQPADPNLLPPLAPAKADIRDIGIPDLMAANKPSNQVHNIDVRPPSILLSAEALGRMAQIIDADGDRRDADLSVEELDAILDHMSADEVRAVSEHLGIGADITFAAQSATHARRALLLFLRPALGVVIETEQQPFDMTGAPSAAVDPPVVSRAEGPMLAGTVTLDAFMGTTEAERIRWLKADATKVDITRLLDERQVAYKAREDKAALADKLLTSLTNEV